MTNKNVPDNWQHCILAINIIPLKGDTSYSGKVQMNFEPNTTYSEVKAEADRITSTIKEKLKPMQVDVNYQIMSR